MFTKEIEVPNATGLHARPASGLVRLCKTFESKITIIKGEKTIDAKSIIQVLAGGIQQHTKIVLQVEGADEETAGPAVAEYIESLTE